MFVDKGFLTDFYGISLDYGIRKNTTVEFPYRNRLQKGRYLSLSSHQSLVRTSPSRPESRTDTLELSRLGIDILSLLAETEGTVLSSNTLT